MTNRGFLSDTDIGGRITTDTHPPTSCCQPTVVGELRDHIVQSMIEPSIESWCDLTVSTNVDANTRTRLLAAAERLLLETGYDQVSVRGICAAAGANPAAVHYHFGSKDALVAALLEDRLGPVWAQPLATLSGEAASVSRYVDAIIDPFADLAADPIGRLHLHLLARLVLSRRHLKWSSRWFRMDSWADVLVADHPDLSEKEAGRRWMLAFELILQQFGDPLGGDRTLSAGSIAALRSFVRAGLDAPVVDEK